MKKTIILLAFILCAAFCAAQTVKKDTVAKPPVMKPAEKPKYDFFYRVPEQEFAQILDALTAYRQLIPYSPFLKEEQRAPIEKSLDTYLINFKKSVKLDSVINTNGH